MQTQFALKSCFNRLVKIRLDTLQQYGVVCVLPAVNGGSTCQRNDRQMQTRGATDLQRRARLSIVLRWDEVTVQFDAFPHWR